MAMANDLAWRKGIVTYLTNEFCIAGESKCLESTRHNKQKKKEKVRSLESKEKTKLMFVNS